MNKLLAAALFAVALVTAQCGPVAAQEECYKVEDFTAEALSFNDPAPVQVEDKFVQPLLTVVNEALINSGAPIINPLFVTNIWYTFTEYGDGVAGVVTMFGGNGCFQGIVLVPVGLIADVINNPNAGSL